MAVAEGGGIPLQIIEGVNGFLVDSVEQAAERTLCLLRNREMATQMGVNGKKHVRNNFLIISHMKDYMLLYNALLNG